MLAGAEAGQAGPPQSDPWAPARRRRGTWSDLGLIWDPGNEAMLGGPPFPSGYQSVRGRIEHVHVKDVAMGEWTVAGEGACQWGEQLGTLAADGYEGLLSIETHMHEPNSEAATRRAVTALRREAETAGLRL